MLWTKVPILINKDNNLKKQSRVTVIALCTPPDPHRSTNEEMKSKSLMVGEICDNHVNLQGQ